MPKKTDGRVGRELRIHGHDRSAIEKEAVMPGKLFPQFAITLRLFLLEILTTSVLVPICWADNEVAGEDFRRLPPIVAAGTATDHSEPTAFVSYAAGTVLLDVPAAWSAGEIVGGRSIRLVISPLSLPQKIAELRDGMWIAVRYRASAERELDSERQFSRLRKELTAAQPTSEIETLELQGHAAFRQTFVASDGRRGFHLFVELPHATVQFGAIAAEANWPARAALLNELIGECRFADPDLPTPRLAQALDDAAPIVGAWKSHEAQIQWCADGRVVLRADGRGSYALDELGHLDFAQSVRALEGTFSAHDDLVEITWEDGSQLNYRWKLVEGELYLTDHLGRVSLLWRLLK